MKTLYELARAAGCALLAASLSGHARNGFDASGLWWNPDDAGWAAGLTHQGDTLFVTLLVYGRDGGPTWLAASDTRATGEPRTFSGILHAASRPGTPGTASPGAISLQFVDDDRAAWLTYSIDGVKVERRPLIPYTFRAPDLRGTYTVMLTRAPGECAVLTPFETRVPVSFEIRQTGSRVGLVTVTQDGYECVFEADGMPFGSRLDVTGAFYCEEGFLPVVGIEWGFTLTASAASDSGFAGELRIPSVDRSCHATFGMAAARHFPR